MVESAIWTDNETSRDLIWRAYIGFKENYENYLMYKKSYGVDHKVYVGGLWRYAVSFYEEIRPFVKKLRIEQADEIETIIDNGLLLEDNNIRIVIRFFNNFLFVSGMKNIIFAKDNRNGIEKVAQDFYKISK